MILLEVSNRILRETLAERIRNPKRELIDLTLADFDGVSFHVSTPDPNNKGILQVSISWSACPELLNYGGVQDLKKIYGALLCDQAEEGYHVTLRINLDALPEDSSKLPLKVSNLKRHILAAPFKRAFEQIAQKQGGGDMIRIAYRDNEAFYIKPESDRCIVLFSIFFKDPDDAVFAKVFLQEFADARRSMRGVPAVSYTHREPPQELAGYPECQDAENTGFVSFVLFDQHMAPNNIFKTINLVQTFRDYLHYHIKCSKAYMHQRMRERVASWLQVLNRARPDPIAEKKKKLASGRTFVRR